MLQKIKAAFLDEGLVNYVSSRIAMDDANVYEEINPTFNTEKFLHDFEIFALDNLSGSFQLRRLYHESDIRAYVHMVGDRLSKL